MIEAILLPYLDIEDLILFGGAIYSLHEVFGPERQEKYQLLPSL